MNGNKVLKKNSVARDLSCKKQSAGGVNTSGRSVIMDSFMSDVKKSSDKMKKQQLRSCISHPSPTVTASRILKLE